MIIEFRRALDIASGFSQKIAAAAVLVPASPVIVVGCAFAAFSTGSLPLYFHERVGRGGKKITVIKIRTMREMSHEEFNNYLVANPREKAQWKEKRKLSNDPRVSPIGGVMRRYSIDELPQLINVIVGDLRLVGPRPITSEELSRYGRSARYYLQVTPGLTGLWQVLERSSGTYKRRVALDRYYVSRQSLLLDLSIILKTPGALLASRGAF